MGRCEWNGRSRVYVTGFTFVLMDNPNVMRDDLMTPAIEISECPGAPPIFNASAM
jgi:hypothetical protein